MRERSRHRCRDALRGSAAVALGAALAKLPRAAGAQSPTEVRLTFAPSSPVETEILERVVADFEAANPDIDVVLEPVSAQYPEKLQTDLAAGTAADVFYVDSSYAPDLMSRGVLMPLDDCLAASGIGRDDYYPGLIQAFT